jgi:hypothetical protein
VFRKEIEMNAEFAARASSDTLPMTVADMAFLIDRLGEDCSPLQFLRELTKNAIEAISRREKPNGEAIWDVDWGRYDLTSESVQKLCVIDTGVGMTGEEMVEYINKLSSSISKQSKTGNFGVGAKISAAPLNPEGLVYLSWKDGVGYMIQLHRDPVLEEYGLLRFKNGEFWQRIQNDLKPDAIEESGTMVVLLGNSPEENTIEAPPKTPMPRKWILRYLNSRFFRFPEGISVKAREGWNLPRGDKHNFLRTATGQGEWLDENAQARGTMRLNDSSATAHWWILKDDVDLNSGHYTPPGHVAALYQDEIYELTSGNAGYARLQAFGVIFGGNRVVIYVEPDNGQIQSVSANTARTQLLIEGESLDWSLYASEFRENMPEELAEFQDEIGLLSKQGDHKKAIRERLKTIRELFRFGRYRPSKNGKYSVSDTNESSKSNPPTTTNENNNNSGSRGSKSRKGDIYSLFADDGETSADLVNSPVEPETIWISVLDNSRNPGDLEDRAARYLPEQNTLLINADFRAFTDMIERWERLYDGVTGATPVIKAVVQEWFEQQLIETVMSAIALKQGGRWSTSELPELWSEAALTAAVLPRYHINLNVKRNLGQKIGKLASSA